MLNRDYLPCKMENTLALLTFVCLVQNAFSQVGPFSYNATTGQNISCSNTSGGADLCFTETGLLLTTLDEPSSTVRMETSTNATTIKTAQSNVTTALPPNVTNPSNATRVETTTQPTEVTSQSYGTTVGLNDLQPISDDICTCDLHMNLCDINCCCDLDCSESDRFVFSSCFHKPAYPVDTHYCYRTHFIYHNNTEFKMVWSQDGMFCIVENNLPMHVQHRNREAIKSLDEFNQLLRTKKTYSWPSHTIQQFSFQAERSQKAGEIVWVLRGPLIVPLSLPTKLVGGLCQASKSVEYLRNWQSSCLQTVADSRDCEDREILNAAFFYKNLSFVATSPGFNVTLRSFTVEDCANNSCVPVTALLCFYVESGSKIPKPCVESADFPLPVFDEDTSTCLNVVHRVRYVIRHNGTRGITDVTAYITLSPLAVKTSLQFAQSFDVEFVWASAAEPLMKRSGRPGYVVGKPVMAGRKVTQVSKEKSTLAKDAIELSVDSNKWLSLPAVDSSGVCDISTRNSVTFGENRRSMCQLPLYKSNFSTTANCASVQNLILTLLVGDAISNITEIKHFNLYVATFGDSSVEKTGDWVGVQLESLSSPVPKSKMKRANHSLVCHGLVTSLHMDLVFSYIGSLANPQAKILGVAFRLGSLQDLVFNCDPMPCTNTSDTSMQYFPLLSSVSFVDITEPAVTHFAEPPVYEVKLPHDFFYPFFSASIRLSCSAGLVLGALAVTRLMTIVGGSVCQDIKP